MDSFADYLLQVKELKAAPWLGLKRAGLEILPHLFEKFYSLLVRVPVKI